MQVDHLTQLYLEPAEPTEVAELLQGVRTSAAAECVKRYVKRDGTVVREAVEEPYGYLVNQGYQKIAKDHPEAVSGDTHAHTRKTYKWRRERA